MKDTETIDKLVAYLKDTYQPDAIIAYGSFADGSANKNSDFDALVIADNVRKHDSSVIDGIVLDVFIYPRESFQSEFDPEEFVQVWDGQIILDTEGIPSIRTLWYYSFGITSIVMEGLLWILKKQ